MRIITTITEMSEVRHSLKGEIGLTPTMGFLHAGHLSLVARARAENDVVIATIFVNPTQFGPSEDLAAYPRDLPRDLALLAQVGVDIVFIPEPEEMYPPGFQTWVVLEDLPDRLEGAHRPGHFRGVATVVTKLFHLTRPTRAYFGQKDAQQATVIRRFTRDLNFDIDIVICATVREADGLALSSRNIYLNPDERVAATVLFRALSAAQSAFGEGQRQAETLRGLMQDILAAEPLAQPDYVSIANLDTLAELSGEIEGQALASMAVRIGRARLIDNMILG